MENILKTIKTEEDRIQLDAELDVLLECLYKISDQLEEIKRTKIRLKTLKLLEEEMEKEKINQTDMQSVQTFLVSIKKKLAELKTLQITLAFEPSMETIDIIHDFAQKTFGEYALVDVKIDKKIMAGAIIVFEGLYRKWTLDEKVDEYLKHIANGV